MVIEEAGRLYNIDEETGLVTEASLLDPEVEAIADEYRIGNRVEAAGQLGEIISITPSVYGAAFGVKFDNGDVDEFLESQLKLSTVDKKTYESPILEVYGRYEDYQKMPTYTDEELEYKEREARWLHLNASTLRTHASQGGVQDPKLDEIILTTTSDLRELKEIRESVEAEYSKSYLASQPRYKISDDINGYGGEFNSDDDASWLGVMADDLEVSETTDVDLSSRAVEVVSFLSREQLEDEEFMRVAGSYQHDYLQMTEAQTKQFDAYLKQAIEDRLKELPETRTASADNYNLDDASDIFI